MAKRSSEDVKPAQADGISIESFMSLDRCYCLEFARPERVRNLRQGTMRLKEEVAITQRKLKAQLRL